eukprot:2625421-Alexandrium_andersonii.AAC.1
MSASLVGSEMCIRDSLRATPESARKRPEVPESSPGTFGQSLKQRYAPVSYTHLTLPTICSV